MRFFRHSLDNDEHVRCTTTDRLVNGGLLILVILVNRALAVLVI